MQTVFDEPMERMNTDQLDTAKLGWSESAAWDELAEYYERALASIRETDHLAASDHRRIRHRRGLEAFNKYALADLIAQNVRRKLMLPTA